MHTPIFIVYAVVVGILSLLPGEGSSIGPLDKLQHLLVYYIFAVFGYRAIKDVPAYAYLCVGIIAYGGLLEGSVLTETIFSWPGLGRYLATAFLTLDFDLVDADRDAMADDFERAHGLDTGRDDGDEDKDGDGASNRAEYEALTSASLASRAG